MTWHSWTYQIVQANDWKLVIILSNVVRYHSLLCFHIPQLSSDEIELSLVFANNRDRENAIHHLQAMWRSCFSSDGLEIESWNVTMAFPCSLYFVWTMLACLFSGVTVDATAASWLSANLLSATSAAPKFEIFIASICLVKGLFCRHFETRQVVKKVNKPLFFGQKLLNSTARGSGTRVTNIVWAAADGRLVAGW